MCLQYHILYVIMNKLPDKRNIGRVRFCKKEQEVLNYERRNTS